MNNKDSDRIKAREEVFYFNGKKRFGKIGEKEQQ